MRIPALAGAALLASLGLAACQDHASNPGPMARTGQTLDKAGQNVKDAVDPGPAQRAGRSIDRTLAQ